jgi:hypothetical protein
MAVLRMNLKEWKRYHERLADQFHPAALRGARSAALATVAVAQRRTRQAPPANPAGKGKGGAVNTGDYLRRWRWITISDGARVLNDHPAAAVIEYGRRPGSAPPPEQAIRDWLIRRLAVEGGQGEPRRASGRDGHRPTWSPCAARPDIRGCDAGDREDPRTRSPPRARTRAGPPPMTICHDYSATRTMPELGASEAPPVTPDEVDGLLVREARDLKLIKSTGLAMVDVHTGVTRALRSYLESLSGEHEGRPMRFHRVVEDWAEVYADGGVYPVGRGVVGEQRRLRRPRRRPAAWARARSTTVLADPNGRGVPPGSRRVHDRRDRARAYCNDKEERVGARKLLDDAFAPVSVVRRVRAAHALPLTARSPSYGLARALMTEDVEQAGPGHPGDRVTCSTRARRGCACSARRAPSSARSETSSCAPPPCRPFRPTRSSRRRRAAFPV